MEKRALNAALATALKDYAEEPQVKMYLRKVRHPNFWTIMSRDKGSYETHYSKILRWMLDPHENHGAGDSFAARIIALIQEKRPDLRRDAESEPAQGTPSRGVKRSSYVGCDTEALSRNIDIFYYNGRTSSAITFEVKMGSTDHTAGKTAGSQLDKYFNAVESHQPTVRECHDRYYVYLTIGGVAPALDAASKDCWVNLSYDDVASVAREWVLDVEDDGAVKIVRDFIFDLERHVSLAGDSMSTAAEAIQDNPDIRKQALRLISEYEDPKETQGSNVTLFDEISKLLEDDGIDRTQLKLLIGALSESIVENVQNHTPSPEGQRLIEFICEELTGSSLAPNEVADVKEKYRIGGHFETIRRTRGKGQGIEGYASGESHFYISAGNYRGRVCLPNDPGLQQRKIFASHLPSRDSWTVDYWLGHKSELIELVKRSIDEEYQARIEHEKQY